MYCIAHTLHNGSSLFGSLFWTSIVKGHLRVVNEPIRHINREHPASYSFLAVIDKERKRTFGVVFLEDKFFSYLSFLIFLEINQRMWGINKSRNACNCYLGWAKRMACMLLREVIGYSDRLVRVYVIKRCRIAFSNWNRFM